MVYSGVPPRACRTKYSSPQRICGTKKRGLSDALKKNSIWTVWWRLVVVATKDMPLAVLATTFSLSSLPIQEKWLLLQSTSRKLKKNDIMRSRTTTWFECKIRYETDMNGIRHRKWNRMPFGRIFWPLAQQLILTLMTKQWQIKNKLLRTL